MPTSAPGGIARLRRSIDASADTPNDPMNLDDFIVPNSVASPAGILTPSSTDNASSVNFAHPGSTSRHAKAKPQLHIPSQLPPSSLPKSSVAPNRAADFDYVRKRVRKTSIDERRGVSQIEYCCPNQRLTASRIAKDQQTSHLKYLL